MKPFPAAQGHRNPRRKKENATYSHPDTKIVATCNAACAWAYYPSRSQRFRSFSRCRGSCSVCWQSFCWSRTMIGRATGRRNKLICPLPAHRKSSIRRGKKVGLGKSRAGFKAKATPNRSPISMCVLERGPCCALLFLPFPLQSVLVCIHLHQRPRFILAVSHGTLTVRSDRIDSRPRVKEAWHVDPLLHSTDHAEKGLLEVVPCLHQPETSRLVRICSSTGRS